MSASELSGWKRTGDFGHFRKGAGRLSAAVRLKMSASELSGWQRMYGSDDEGVSGGCRRDELRGG
jgi:hypothetical protein